MFYLSAKSDPMKTAFLSATSKDGKPIKFTLGGIKCAIIPFPQGKKERDQLVTLIKTLFVTPQHLWQILKSWASVTT